MSYKKQSGFTLLELLIVFGILAILAIAIILVLNPAQFMMQSRDSKRINDLQILNTAFNIMMVNQSGTVDWDGPNFSANCAGQASSTVFVSVPYDNGETPPFLPGNWHWGQVSSTDSYRIEGKGWIPIDFGVTGAGLGAKLPVLPLDPVNTFASGQYYTYVCGDPEINTSFESDKFKPYIITDGGDDDNAYEIGNKFISPLRYSIFTDGFESGNFTYNKWLNYQPYGNLTAKLSISTNDTHSGQYSMKVDFYGSVGDFPYDQLVSLNQSSSSPSFNYRFAGQREGTYKFYIKFSSNFSLPNNQTAINITQNGGCYRALPGGLQVARANNKLYFRITDSDSNCWGHHIAGKDFPIALDTWYKIKIYSKAPDIGNMNASTINSPNGIVRGYINDVLLSEITNNTSLTPNNTSSTLRHFGIGAGNATSGITGTMYIDDIVITSP